MLWFIGGVIMGGFWNFFSEPGIIMSFYVVNKVRNNLSPGGFSKIRPKSFLYDLSYGRFSSILLDFLENAFFNKIYHI